MANFLCVVYNGGRFTGCDARVDENGIEITIFLSISYYKLHRDQIIKIIKFNNNRKMFRIEFNKGTIKNELVDLKIVRKKKFANLIETMGYTVETREYYERALSY